MSALTLKATLFAGRAGPHQFCFTLYIGPIGQHGKYWDLVSVSFYREGNWGIMRLNKLSKVTKSAPGRFETKIRQSHPRTYCLHLYFVTHCYYSVNCCVMILPECSWTPTLSGRSNKRYFLSSFFPTWHFPEGFCECPSWVRGPGLKLICTAKLAGQS